MLVAQLSVRKYALPCLLLCTIASPASPVLLDSASPAASSLSQPPIPVSFLALLSLALYIPLFLVISCLPAFQISSLCSAGQVFCPVPGSMFLPVPGLPAFSVLPIPGCLPYFQSYFLFRFARLLVTGNRVL